MKRHQSLISMVAGLALLAACADDPAQLTSASADGSAPVLAPPPKCGAAVALSITLRDDSGDDLFSDGGGPYVEGQNGVEAHINDPTGNLSIWTTESSRFLNAEYTPSGGGAAVTVPIDRVYTNTHSNSCALAGLAVGGTGTAVLEAESRANGTGSTVAKARYGKTCTNGSATLVTVSHPDADTWIITGTAGSYCTLNSRKKWQHAGTVGPFQMTLVR